MPDWVVNGARIHYEEAGAGPEAIVFAHGFLWSGSMYQFQLEAFRERFRCVAFDFRGQGRSEVTAAGYDMETLAEDAAALVLALGVAPCHFVGLSMGGFVGLRLAIRRPELLRSLTLVESAADPEPRWNVPRYRLLALLVRLFGVGVVAGPIMKIMFGRPFMADPARAELRLEMRRRLLANDTVGALRALGGVLARRGVEDELATIGTPTLVLSGEADEAIGPERARRAAERIPGARFVSIPRAGHTATIEEPEAVNSALAAFLESVRNGERGTG